MKGFIQLTAIASGLPVIVRTDCITHVRSLPATSVHQARTVVFTVYDRFDIVTETAEEIQRLMEDAGDNEDDTSADDCKPDNSLRRYIEETEKKFSLVNRRISEYLEKINHI
jgi:hypothetical protein